MEVTCSQVPCLQTCHCSDEPLPTSLQAIYTRLVYGAQKQTQHSVWNLTPIHCNHHFLSSRLLYPVNTAHGCISLPFQHILNFDPRLLNIFQINHSHTYLSFLLCFCKIIFILTENSTVTYVNLYLVCFYIFPANGFFLFEISLFIISFLF